MMKWTEEHYQFLEDNIKGTSYRKMRELFNAHFKLSLTENQINGALKRRNLTNGNDGRFKKGRVPFNKGKKGLTTGGVETQFKKGHQPFNYKPIGFERVDRDGYVLIKVQDEGPWQNRWRHKHKVVWEEANGPIPEGHVLIFSDGNKQNIVLSNLVLVSRSELLIMNKEGLIYNQPEATKTGAIIAKVIDSANKLKDR